MFPAIRQCLRPTLLNIILRSASRMAPTPWTPDKYPLARRSDHVDVYQSKAQGSVQIPDPYQWLETNTTETDDWVTAQEAFTRAYLDQVCFPADES